MTKQKTLPHQQYNAYWYQRVLAWIIQNFFSSITNTVLTVLLGYILYVTILPLFDWLFIKATFSPAESRAACNPDGACWSVITSRWEQFFYGFYPEDQRWRINLAFIILIMLTFWMLFKKLPARKYAGLILFLVSPGLCFWLFYGGWGLPVVETGLWGGLMLNLIAGGVGIVFTLPIGVILALGRRSELPVISTFCVIFIEFVRGVPFITVLFMSSVMLPIFLPDGIVIDKLLRAMIGIAIFGGAYMAEVVRGGLQALSKGQYEAAYALGFGYWKVNRLIILPQALRIVIPGIVNSFISLFKDTTLLTQIGIFELLGIAQAATRDPNWAGLGKEGYIFTALIFFSVCLAMSRYSLHIEHKLNQSSHKKRL